MGDLLGSLVWGAKSGQYCVIGGGSLQMVSEPSPGNEDVLICINVPFMTQRVLKP
jgi:hypothetical protein